MRWGKLPDVSGSFSGPGVSEFFAAGDGPEVGEGGAIGGLPGVRFTTQVIDIAQHARMGSDPQLARMSRVIGDKQGENLQSGSALAEVLNADHQRTFGFPCQNRA
jgi:hypothetical protein